MLLSSFNAGLSLPAFWFTIASLVVRKLLWTREVRGCFVLRHCWQSLYLLLSDRTLFDLQLLCVFCLWSNNLSPQEVRESTLKVPPLQGLLKVWGNRSYVLVGVSAMFQAWSNTHFHKCLCAHTHTHTLLSFALCSHTCWHTHIHNTIQYTAHAHCAWSLALALPIANTEVNMFHYLSLSLSPVFLTGRVSFSCSHHRTPQTAIKRDVQHWFCMRKESRERKKKEMRGDTGEQDRKKEWKRGSMWGKMYSTTSPSKPGLILCLLIFITIAASCKMFDGFVQILVPLIHNYCYTCRTKGNFRRGSVWKAAARLWGWWEISVGPHVSSKP